MICRVFIMTEKGGYNGDLFFIELKDYETRHKLVDELTDKKLNEGCTRGSHWIIWIETIESCLQGGGNLDKMKIKQNTSEELKTTLEKYGKLLDYEDVKEMYNNVKVDYSTKKLIFQ